MATVFSNVYPGLLVADLGIRFVDGVAGVEDAAALVRLSELGALGVEVPEGAFDLVVEPAAVPEPAPEPAAVPEPAAEPAAVPEPAAEPVKEAPASTAKRGPGRPKKDA